MSFVTAGLGGSNAQVLGSVATIGMGGYSNLTPIPPINATDYWIGGATIILKPTLQITGIVEELLIITRKTN